MDTLCDEKFFERYICKSLYKRLHETLTVHGTECTLTVIVEGNFQLLSSGVLTIYTKHPVGNIVNKTGRGGRMTRYKVNPNQLDGLKRVEKLHRLKSQPILSSF